MKDLTEAQKLTDKILYLVGELENTPLCYLQSEVNVIKAELEYLKGELQDEE